MTIIKKYFLCALMLNTVSLFGMHTGICVQEIRNKIDFHHLGISDNACFTPVIGSIASYYKTTRLPKGKAATEIQTIASYIPEDNNNKKQIFQKLVKHWYVHYLVQALIKEKIKEFEEVKGSTLDQLYTPDFSNDICGVNEMVYNKAHESFFKDMHRKNEVEIQALPFTDIHLTALYGHTHTINPSSLIMSSDSQYLKSKDIKDNKIVWVTKTGDQANLTKEERKNIKWSSGYVPPYMQPCAIDKKDQYYATSINTAFTRPINVDKSKPAIILYTRPEKISYFCQRAFENNQCNHEELMALKNSNSFKAIEGFPRKNLEQLINRNSRYAAFLVL